MTEPGAMDTARGSEVIRRLSAGQALDGIGLGRVDGRWDLRGLTAEPPTTGEPQHAWTASGNVELSPIRDRVRLEKVVLRDLDLSGSRIEHAWIDSSTFVNCRFDGATLRFSAHRSTFEQCSFVGAVLRDTVLSVGEGSRYNGVSFEGADMRSSSPGRGQFVDCDFSRAKLNGVGFLGTRLARCRFAGRLDNVIFARHQPILGLLGHEETLIDVDFSDCRFRFVEFHRLNLDRVRLPIADDHIVSPNIRCVLDSLIRLGAEFPDAGGLAVLEAIREHMGPKQRQGVIVIGDLVVKGDQAMARAVRQVVDRALRACA